MGKRLIILGASVRAAAFSALRAGFEPYAIDCYADRDLAAVCPAVKIQRYPHDFEPTLAAAPPAPWIYTGGLENYPRLVGRLGKLRPLWGNAGKGLREIRQPDRLARIAAQAGLRFPRTQRLLPAKELPARWLVKRRRSSGGLGVRFATERDKERPDRHHYFQEYVEGQSASAVFVAARSRAVLVGASQQLLGRDVGMEDRPFLYAGSIGPLVLSDDETSRLQSLGNLLAEQFGLAGLFGVDFVRTSEDLWLLEVNPRYTASVEVLERATGVSFLARHAAACQNRDLMPQPMADSGELAGKQVVYARKNGKVSPAFNELVDKLNRPGEPPDIADLPQIGERIVAGQPVATVFAAGGTSNEVELQLRNRVAAVSEVLSTEY
jgi:uncharacterized protein